MIGGGDFDLYCKVCGLPFRPIEEKEEETQWLNDTVLTCSGQTLLLKSLETSGQFEINQTNPSKKILNKLKANDCLEDDNKILPYALLEKHPRACFLCHSACENRKDAGKVKKDLKMVQIFQEQIFNDPEFLEKESLHYLLKKPGMKSPVQGSSKKSVVKELEKPVKESKKPLEKLTVKNLHDVCETLGIKKAKSKTSVIKDIKEFVCS